MADLIYIMGMQRMAAVIFLVSLCLCLAGPAHGQAMTSEEVTSVMEAPGAVQAFSACVAGKPHPTTVDLDLVISESGSATLVYTNPVVDQDLYACFSEAASGLSFKAAGQKHEITYPMDFPPYVEGGGAPTPPEGGGGAGASVDASGAGTQKAGRTLQYKVALAMTVMGALLTAGGPGFVLTGLLVYAFMDDGSSLRKPLLIAFSVGGAVLLAGGIVLLVFGVKKLKKAKQAERASAWMPRPGLWPLEDGQGAAATLSWTF
jgi:hypothetical protein